MLKFLVLVGVHRGEGRYCRGNLMGDQTPRLWNHLPIKLKSCQSITIFRSLLKIYLMSQFFKDDVYL